MSLQWWRFAVLATVACGTPKETVHTDWLPQSEGSFVVTAEGLEFGELTLWQASLVGGNDGLAALLEGREVTVYTLGASAAHAVERQALGFGLVAETWRELVSGQPLALWKRDDDSHHYGGVSAHIDDRYWHSDGGSVTVTSFGDGKIAGTLETTLVEEGGDTGVAGVPTTATFQGAIEPSCEFTPIPEEGVGTPGVSVTPVVVGVEDPECAALFE